MRLQLQLLITFELTTVLLLKPKRIQQNLSLLFYANVQRKLFFNYFCVFIEDAAYQSLDLDGKETGKKKQEKFANDGS